MPTLDKTFKWVKFPSSALTEALEAIRKVMPPKSVEELIYNSVTNGDEAWSVDTIDEFIYEYARACSDASFWFEITQVDPKIKVKIRVQSWIPRRSSVAITAPNREIIARVMGVFDRAYENNRISDEEISKYISGKMKIFIGHGGNATWKELKDHLHEQHGYDVVAYETGARGGY